MEEDQKFLQMAIAMAEDNVKENQGGPFGAVIVKEGQVIGRGINRVTQTNDPTAHAEITAIRDACNQAGDFSLDGSVIYSSCEPCPMCLGAIYWARISRIVFASSNVDAAAAGFDDSFIYKQIPLPIHLRSIPTIKLDLMGHLSPFEAWEALEQKTRY
ncbi:MAG: nucleoside deaminase [Bacteroidales bacterium]